MDEALTKIEDIRNKIIKEKDTLYLDFAASGQAYEPIEKKILEFLKTYSNTHSEFGRNSKITTKTYVGTRQSLRTSLDIADNFYIFPVGTGATGAIKKFQEILGLYIPPATRKRYKINSEEKPLVIVGPFEHHSNELSWRQALCDVERVRLASNNTFDLNHLEEILNRNNDREIIGAFTAASNVTGLLSPVEKICKLIKKYNGIVCIDAATYSAHGNINSALYDAMFLSPHKLIGGPGSCGLLVLKKELYDTTLSPSFAGGGTVSYVSRSAYFFEDDIETREDPGTPGILQFVRAGLAYELRNSVGIDAIQKKEKELRKKILERFSEFKNIKLYSHKEQEGLPIFSFNIANNTPYEVSEQLSEEFGIQTRAGCVCAGPYIHHLLDIEEGKWEPGDCDEKPGIVRASFSYINNINDVEIFFDAIDRIANK